ncbi:MAG: hypothetical protein PWP08_1010 [Methanofollis sp.]|nr:hypothetical protein [Methanofollis sp.]
MKFTIILERDEEERYVAECTDRPGCLSGGDTPGEAIRNINEAIPGCITSRLKVAAGSVHLPPVDRTVTTSLDISGPTDAKNAP